MGAEKGPVAHKKWYADASVDGNGPWRTQEGVGGGRCVRGGAVLYT